MIIMPGNIYANSEEGSIICIPSSLPARGNPSNCISMSLRGLFNDVALEVADHVFENGNVPCVLGLKTFRTIMQGRPIQKRFILVTYPCKDQYYTPIRSEIAGRSVLFLNELFAGIDEEINVVLPSVQYEQKRILTGIMMEELDNRFRMYGSGSIVQSRTQGIANAQIYDDPF